MRGDGTIDDDETAAVEGIAKWMDINKEAICGTRPFKVFGEGPATDAGPTTKTGNFNEGKGKPLSANDVRFTTKGNTLYVNEMGWPTEPLLIKSLGTDAKLPDKPIDNIKLLGSDQEIAWKQEAASLAITPPATPVGEHAFVYTVTMKAE